MNQLLRDKLLALQRRDSGTRARLLEEGRLYAAYVEEMRLVHAENAVELDRLVALHGWPGASLVGTEGCRAAWLVAQHAICTPALQRRFLQLLMRAAARAEVPGVQVALLTDRIRFNEERPQLYGTILDWNENGELSCVIAEPEDLDARRREMGLAPFAEALQQHRQQVWDEGGRPPVDFPRYIRERRAWAESVGWLPASGESPA